MFKKTTEERFWEKVDKTNSCWNWTAAKSKLGYGRLKVNRNDLLAHRFSYEMVHGMIDPELCLDHLCRNRACVNPAHLEPVSIGENIRRGLAKAGINFNKTHCIRNHLLSGDNLYLTNDGRRQCRACGRIRTAQSRMKMEAT